MSRALAWVPKGPALETYETKIRADLEAALANIELPEGAPLFLKLYMIGRNEESANPMIMVCCVHRAIRKEAELSIRESHILDRFPGFGLGSSALLLESHGLEELLTKVRSPTCSRETTPRLTSFQEHRHLENQSQSIEERSESDGVIEICASFPHKLGGTIAFVSKSHGEVRAVHTATGGPIFELDNELYQITASHGMRFGDPDAKVNYSTSELDECEFDGQSDYSDDIATGIGSATPEAFSTQSSDEDSHSSQLSCEEAPKTDQSTPVAQAPNTSAQPSGSPPPSNVEGANLTGDSGRIHLQFHNPDLDYVLLKLSTQSSLAGPTSTFKSWLHGSMSVTKTSHVGPDDTRVFVVSPNGPIPGTVSPQTTSYKMHGFTKLQQLLTVQLDGVLLKGCSGSAVVDFVTGALYGQIVLGNPGQSLAYCVRAPSIFADIISRLGHIPLLDERHWQTNSRFATGLTSVPFNYDAMSTDLSRNSPGTSGSSSRKQTGRTFACPFYLQDRIRHSNCLHTRLTRLSDVRQHLVERAHYQVVHCPVCGVTFQGRPAEARRFRDAHVRAAVCDPSPAPFNYPGITEWQDQRIRGIARTFGTHRYTEVYRWFLIWDFLFPGEPRPESPFLDNVP